MTPAQTVADAAYRCPLLVRARALAAFVGAGRPVTAKAVLRRADIPAACAAAGLPGPGRVVSAAHVPALHRAWTAAQGAALLTVGHKEACAATATDDPLDQWRHAVAALLRAESDDPGRTGAATVRADVATLPSRTGTTTPHRLARWTWTRWIGAWRNGGPGRPPRHTLDAARPAGDPSSVSPAGRRSAGPQVVALSSPYVRRAASRAAT